jgi:phosphinothricin acetyltransferase
MPHHAPTGRRRQGRPARRGMPTVAGTVATSARLRYRPAMSYDIRLATKADLEQFAEIVNHYIENTTINFHVRPLSEDDWEATWQVLHERYPFLVATEGDLVRGIAWASPWKLRGAYDWTAEVSVYVRNGHEGQGIGRALCSRMLEIMDAQGYHAIVAVIALPNEASVALHQSLGFELGGTLKRLGYKNGQWRDVSYWQRPHANADDSAPPPLKLVAEVAG